MTDVNLVKFFDFFDSSDYDSDEYEENLVIPPPFIFDEDEDEEDVLQHLPLPVINGIQRVERVKIINYVEHVVRSYIERDFIMHFRLSRDISYNLISRFGASQMFLSLQEHPAGRESITAEKHILCYLWFVGHESGAYRDVADRFGITLSSMYNVIARVTDFILSISSQIIRYPSAEEREATRQYYLQEKRFPGVVGSIDGSHIRIGKPLIDKDSYINQNKYFSVQLQGVVDHKGKFMDVFVGFPGSVHDARVFRESPLYNSLSELCQEGNYLLGDSAYPCLQHMIVPYRDNGHLTRAQTDFNVRLSSCRVVIESSFGNLKQRFRQLYHFKLRNIVRLVQTIYACCVLHNIANENDMELFEEPLVDDHPDPEVESMPMKSSNTDNQLGRELRDEMCRQLATQYSTI